MSATAKSFRAGVLELVLIVVGVLAAFGLEAWWSGRSEARATTESLRAIAVEFEAAREILEGLEESHGRNLEQFGALKALLASTGPEPPSDTILRLSQPLWTNDNFHPTMPVYSEFLASGGMTGLDDDSLTHALFTYELALESNQDFDDYLRTSMTTSWEPTLSSRIPVVTSPDDFPAALGLMPEPRLLASDLEFRNLIEVRLIVEQALLERRQSLVAAVDEVLRLLGPSG